MAKVTITTTKTEEMEISFPACFKNESETTFIKFNNETTAYEVTSEEIKRNILGLKWYLDHYVPCTTEEFYKKLKDTEKNLRTLLCEASTIPNVGHTKDRIRKEAQFEMERLMCGVPDEHDPTKLMDEQADKVERHYLGELPGVYEDQY